MAQSEVLADAAFIQKDIERRAEFVEGIRKLRKENFSDSSKALYALVEAEMGIPALSYPGDRKTFASKLNYDLVQMKSGNRAKAIPIYLAILDRFSDLATNVRAAVGLISTRSSDTLSRTKREINLDLPPVIPTDYASDQRLEFGRQPPAPVLFPHPEGIYSAAFSPCGNFIGIAGRKRGKGDAGVFVWKIEPLSPEVKRQEIGHDTDDAAYIAFSPDGTCVAVPFVKTAGVFYATSAQARLHQLTHDGQITMASYSRDSRYIVTASWDGSARVWDAQSGKRLHVLQATPFLGNDEGHVVNSAVFSPDGSTVLLACTDCHVSLWDTKRGRKVGALPVLHDGDGVSSANFSPDGKLIVTTGASDRKIAVWDAKTKELVAAMGGKPLHSNDLWHAEFSPDSTKLVTASKDGWSLLWDVQNDAEITRLKHPAEVYVAHFSPDGKRIVTACEDGNAYLWNVG